MSSASRKYEQFRKINPPQFQVGEENDVHEFLSGIFRGRFPSGGVSGYRNYGVRGRGSYGGNYGGGRGYAQDDFSGRTEFNNRGGYRRWSSNRGGDGYQSYQRTDNPGGYVARTNRGGGDAYGTARHMTPHAHEM